LESMKATTNQITTHLETDNGKLNKVLFK